MRSILSVFLLFFISSCSKININVTQQASFVTVPDTTQPSVTINQATNETIGTCSFSSITEPMNRTGFSYRVTFSERIDPSSFTVADIVQSGTGGSVNLEWELTSCGDNTNFKLTAKDLEGNGTIVPVVLPGGVTDASSNSNFASTASDNSVSFLREWTQEAFIKASNSDSFDHFGGDVSINGETLVVGAINEDSDATTITNGDTSSSSNASSNSGAVYVYKRSGSLWSQEAYIKANNTGAGDYFGSAVSLHRDTLVVGVPEESSDRRTITNGSVPYFNDARSASGAVYVYKRNATTWTMEAYIKASNADSLDYFGSSVSVWGDYVAVGSREEDSNQTTITNGGVASADNSSNAVGAVYVYKRSGFVWAEDAYVKPAVPFPFSYFGTGLSLRDNILAVGAPAGNSNAGEVSIFERTAGGWTSMDVIRAVNSRSFTDYGSSVSLSKDALAVGSHGEKSSQNTITNGPTASADTSLLLSGAVYVYTRTGSAWSQEAYIKASNANDSHQFGFSVSLDGNTLAVGAPRENSAQSTITNGTSSATDTGATGTGAVYVYRRKSSQWLQEAYIKASNSGGVDLFGTSVSLSGDSLVVGAPSEDSHQSTITNGPTANSDNTLSNSGGVYVYRFNGRLFDVTDAWGSSTSSSITLNWHRTGGLATSYRVAYQTGPTAPVDCSSGTVVDVGNVGTFTESPLSSTTTYSFRVCATDGTEITAGSTVTITTN